MPKEPFLFFSCSPVPCPPLCVLISQAFISLQSRRWQPGLPACLGHAVVAEQVATGGNQLPSSDGGWGNPEQR